MDALKKSKRKRSRTNQDSQQSTPATRSSTTDASEPQRHRHLSQSRLSGRSAEELQEDESDDQDMDLHEDDRDQIDATIDQNTLKPQRHGIFSQKRTSSKSAQQPHDDESEDQDMDLDDDDDDPNNTAIDQNDKQARNTTFDETDSEGFYDKCSEEIAFMNDPAHDQIRSEMRQWAHDETSENVDGEMIRLTALLCDLDEKEENRGRYKYTEQRGLSADDLRNREIAEYKRNWARKRYFHDKMSSGKLFDPSADHDATEDAPVRKIIKESKTKGTLWLVEWENSWIH
jgi:hypothetical protein